MTPSTAAAKPFVKPQEDEATLLARDLALLIEQLGTPQGETPVQKSARLELGEQGCLVLRAQLEMDSKASIPDRNARRWDSVRVVAYMKNAPLDEAATRVPLFNAICTDREAIAGAHPTAGLQNLPFVASPIAPGQWVHAVRGLASALRNANTMTFNTHKPDAPRQRAPHWHAT